MTATRWVAVSLLTGCLAAGGCGKPGPVNYPLTGQATWNGQPVPNGLIRLEPDAAAGNPGPATVAVISHGRYATPHGRGVIGGRYRVYIAGNDGVPYRNPDEGFDIPDGKPLFPERVEEVEFPRQACGHDFHLVGP
jgi:hypothetical protein